GRRTDLRQLARPRVPRFHRARRCRGRCRQARQTGAEFRRPRSAAVGSINVSVEVSSAASGPSSFPGLSQAAWQDVAAEGAMGVATSHDVDLNADQLRSLYRLMALSRRVDRQAINLT